MAVNNLGATGSAGGLKYYAAKFTSSGTFTLPTGYGPGNPLTVEAFVVGGGGASGAIASSTATTYGGGGGGGGVRTDVITLTADTPIIVGRGGPAALASSYSMSMGGNGGFSAVNATAKNLFINPELLTYNLSPPPWVGTGTSINTTFGAAVGTGNVLLLAANQTAYGQPYRATAGATYTFSYYGTSATNGGAPSLAVAFWNSATSPLPAANNTPVGFATPTLPALTTSWARYSATFTAPAGADMMTITIQGGGVNGNYSNFQLEVGGSATSYADGDTAGYAWVGPRDGSETVATGTYVAVAGGGGGGGVSSTANPTSSNIQAGYVGATSGGGGSPPLNSPSLAFGGAGGGAGGPATNPPVVYSGTATQQTFNFYPSPAQFGMGAPGYGSANGVNAQLVGGRSMPGPGIQEYGKGGHGAAMLGLANFTYVPPTPVPNTGQGGSGNWASPPLNVSTLLWGNPGADGVVILRYWA